MNGSIDTILAIVIITLAAAALSLLIQPIILSTLYNIPFNALLILKNKPQNRRQDDRRKKIVSYDGVYIREYRFEHISIPVELCERGEERRIGDRRKGMKGMNKNPKN